jgi:hypothetical protein
MKIVFGFLFALLLNAPLFAQETQQQGGNLLLVNGKIIPFKLIESNGYDLVYRTPDPKNKLKKIDPERVFSIKYIDGSERVIFQRDTLDPLEFTEDEMRLFIKGEQDADRLYHNNLNKVGAFTAGVVSSYFGFYGVIGPPLYATFFGAFTPKVEKIKGVDTELIKIPEYREGFEKKARDRKIRNMLISGFIGFAAGAITISVVTNN